MSFQQIDDIVNISGHRKIREIEFPNFFQPDNYMKPNYRWTFFKWAWMFEAFCSVSAFALIFILILLFNEEKNEH